MNLGEHVDTVPGAGCGRHDAEGRDPAVVIVSGRGGEPRNGHVSGQQGAGLVANGCVTGDDHVERAPGVPGVGEGAQGRLYRRRTGVGGDALQPAIEDALVFAWEQQGSDVTAAEEDRAPVARQGCRVASRRFYDTLEPISVRHARRAVDEDHVIGVLRSLPLGVGEAEPEEGRDEQDEQVGEEVAEPPHQDARAGLFERLLPEQRRDHALGLIAHAKPLQQEERACQAGHTKDDAESGQVGEAHVT